MFETDLAELSTADLLASAAEQRAEANRREASLLEHALEYADRHHPDTCPPRPGRSSWQGRERAVVLGGEGCPEVAEFAAAEFGAMLGISAGAAANLIGQALALRHRLPFTLARVRSGDATPWRACRIATACLPLSQEAAALVDKQVAAIVDSVTPLRLENIVKAAKWRADPDAARAAAEEKARERGVYVGRSDEHGTKKVYIRAASGDVIRFDASIAGLAEALKILGDTDTLPHRRAKAIGIIADPVYTEELLRQAQAQLLTQAKPDPRPAPEAAPAPNTAPSPDAGPGTEAGAEPEAEPGPEHGPEPEPEPGPEPGPDDEADRDAPHPSDSDLPDPLDTPAGTRGEPGWPGPRVDPDAAGPDAGEPLDAAAQRAFDARLAQIKDDAYATSPASGAGRPGGRVRPGQTEIYVHLTDHTLATGDGILRVEGLGPLLATQLAELIGHGPYTVKPVIDLNDAVSVNCYEIPDRIRERVKLIHPVEQFPYGTRETHRAMDLDHICPYDPLGPPGQTGTDNLAPLRRYAHRVKTHGRWKVRRLDHKTLEWTTPHGYRFHVTPTGTHPVTDPTPGS